MMSNLRLEVHDEPAAWLEAAYAWLEPQEVEASLVLGVGLRLHNRPEVYPRPWYLASLHAGSAAGDVTRPAG